MVDTLVYSIPLTTRFRGITTREGMLLHGKAGWGEFSPFLEYDQRTCAPWLAAAREAAELGFPDPIRSSIPVNVTVPAVAAEEAAVIVARGGCETAKVKVAEAGQSLGEAEERLAAVREAIGPAGRIRVDANGGWEVDEAVTTIKRLDRAAGDWNTSSSPAPMWRSSRWYGARWTCRSPQTSPSAGPRIPIGCATWPRPILPSSRCSRSAECAPACASPKTSGSRSWSPALWRPASGSLRALPWLQRCPSYRTHVGWPPCNCLLTMS